MAGIRSGSVFADFAGHHLHVEVPVAFSQPLFGDEIRVMIALSGVEALHDGKLSIVVVADSIDSNGFKAVFTVKGMGYGRQTAEYIAYAT